MEWNLFTFENVLSKPKNKVKKYTDKDYREYIKEHFKPDYYNQMFFNIVLDSEFAGHDDFEYSIEPKEQLIFFKELYSSFTYHLHTDEITIFSMKRKYDNAPDDYSVFVKIKDDFIVEFPRVQDLFKEPLCAPACGIWWYNADGTRADMNKYLNLTNEESVIWRNFVHCGNEIIDPKENTTFSYSEWWRDRREYYFFYKLKIHKFGKFGRVFEKHIFDCFSDYTFKLVDLINYFSEENETNEQNKS